MPPPPERVAAIVLAAGASRRMGRNKMLLEFDGVPLIRRTAAAAFAADLAPVVVVLGHESARAQAALHDLACTVATNPDFAGPTSGSLHRGLEALDESVDAAMVMLADMPFVSADMLRSMTATLNRSNAPLAVSRYGEVFAPPLLFRRPLFAELLAWHGEGCGKQVVVRHRDEAVFLDWPIDILQDVDTPEDARAAGLT